MSKFPIKLLFKNAFRVFGKTKLLAAELTILTTVSSTVLTTTLLENINLNSSKNTILNSGNPLEYSIFDVPKNSINVTTKIVSQQDIPRPKYLTHLNSNSNFTAKENATNLNIGSLNNLSWMKNSSNNKLAFYYVTKPTFNGENLLRVGPNASSFASIKIPTNDNGFLLNHTAEIFSFIQNTDSNLVAIPSTDKQIDTNFDMRQILFDPIKNVSAGVSKFGYSQLLGFDLEKTISMSHNVVDTKNKNQFIVQSYATKDGAYAVPNDVLIWLGEQNSTAKQFYEKNAEIFISPTWDFSSFSKILCDVGNSINSLGGVEAKWIPYKLTIDKDNVSSELLFLYDFLTSDNDIILNLRNNVNKYNFFDFDILKIETKEFENPSLIYHENNINKIKTLRYLTTYAWLPSYLVNENKIDLAIDETKRLWQEEINKFVNDLINPYSPWNNVETDLTSLKSILKTNIEKNNIKFDENKLFTFLKNEINAFKFNVIEKELFINVLDEYILNFNNIYNNTFIDNHLDYFEIISEYLNYCLEKYLLINPTLNLFFKNKYTLEGKIQNLGFIYNKSENFSINDSKSGDAFIISKYDNNQKINNVVDVNGNIVNVQSEKENINDYFIPLNNIKLWSYIHWKGKNAEYDPKNIITIDGSVCNTLEEYINKNTFMYKNSYYPVFELFEKINVIDTLKSIYSNVEWLASESQVNEILNSLYPLTKFKNSTLTEKIYKDKVIPLLDNLFSTWTFSSISNDDSVINISAYYFFPKGSYNSTPITGNMALKSSYATIVSSNYINHNKFNEKTNPNGKEVYPNISIFEKAAKLPYFDISNQNTSDNWIFNPDINKIEYYRDFNDWFSKVPSKYKVSINGIQYLITGSGISAEFLYPVSNEQILLVNSAKTNVLYVNESGYARAKINSNGIQPNQYFSLRYNNQKNKISNYINSKKQVKELNNWITKNVSNNSYYLAYKISDSKQPNKLLYTRMNFINNFQKTIIGITMTISIIVLVLSLIFACTLIRSIIKQNRQMFGVCLANGIDKHTLALSFLPFSLIPGLIAGIFGYVFGNLLLPLMNGMISQYWTLPINNLAWNWWMFILIPLIVIGLLFLLSYIVVVWTLRKSAIQILATPSAFRMNVLVEKSNWLFKHFRARTAFKFTYIFGNITRFLILTSIVTAFITLSSISIGSINVFDTALQYTQRNKNYLFALDLYSPTIQGGFYDIKPNTLVGTSSEMQPSIYSVNDKQDKFSYPTKCGDYLINTQIFGSEKTLNLWINKNSSFDKNEYLFNQNITKKLVINAPQNSMLKANIQFSNGGNVFLITPISFVTSSNSISINQKESVEICYFSNAPTYDVNVYKEYWTNPYIINGKTTYFDTIFYPSFNIVPNIQQDVTFFTGKTWVKTLLDFDINLGAISINPWMFAKSLMPSGIIVISEAKNKELLTRSINFYKYLDLVEKGVEKNNLNINYKEYYSSMDLNNKPYLEIKNMNNAYNPINIDGILFNFDNNEIIFDKNKSLLLPKQNVYSKSIDFVLNPDVASKGLPTFELKPETIRMWTYISTNYLNPVYQKWESEIAGLSKENFNYVLGINTVLTNTNLYGTNETKIRNDSTYTYLTSKIININNNQTRNDVIKIMGIKTKPFGKNKEPMVMLYDSNSKNKDDVLNYLLEQKIDDNTYPLIINEVSSKYFKLNVGDVINVDVQNGLFRYKRIGEQQNPNINVNFKVVGITSSKSEKQFYINQKFANEILGYYSNEDNANMMYPKNDYEPFNGLFSGSNIPESINNIAPIYAPLGINPAFPLCVKTTALSRNDNESAILFAWNKLNDILKFDITGNESFNKEGLNKVIAKIIDIANMNNYSQSFMTVTSEIAGLDTKFASDIISGTIDQTVSNIEIVAIFALLPTLFIIITLMATMIVSESRRLIAIMKVLGFGDWFNTFNFMFVYIVVLLLGLLLAIPLTYGFLAGLKAIGFGIFNIIINPVAPWWIYLASASAAGLFFVLLFIIVKAKMKKINLSQAISFGA